VSEEIRHLEKVPWRKYYEVVGQLSLGLISLGMKRGDVVCLYGENAPEWYWGEFAVQTAGGIPAGIPVDAAPAEVKYIVADSALNLPLSAAGIRSLHYWQAKPIYRRCKRLSAGTSKGRKLLIHS